MYKTGRRADFRIKAFFADQIVLVCTFWTAFFVTPARENIGYVLWYVYLMAVFCVTFFLFMMLFRMYNASTFLYIDRVIKNTILSIAGSAIIIFLFLFFLHNTVFSRLFLVTFIVVSTAMLSLQKVVIRKVKPRSASLKRIIYVGNEKMYEKFVRYTKISGYNFEVLGYIGVNGAKMPGISRLGRIDDFESVLMDNPCDYIVFAQSLSEKRSIEPYLEIANDMGIVIRIILDVYNLNTSKWYVSSMGTYPMVTYYNLTLDPVALTIKRAIDVVGAVVGIVLSAPVMLAAAIAIKINSPGPVIFKQTRVGRSGNKFNIYKFRSMYIDAEKRLAELMSRNEMSDNRLFKIKDDPRITRVGKFIRKTSIDELPQFFNVLVGNMSLVGTRPPTVSEVELYERHHYRRISIKPGITGIWQTSGRNAIKNFEEVIRMDLEYIENWSILLDIRLLLKTLHVLFERKGAY